MESIIPPPRRSQPNKVTKQAVKVTAELPVQRPFKDSVSSLRTFQISDYHMVLVSKLKNPQVSNQRDEADMSLLIPMSSDPFREFALAIMAALVSANLEVLAPKRDSAIFNL